MKKEFNLSDFRQLEQDVWTYEEEQVKEFIKRLKEGLSNDCTDCNGWNLSLINKLAGDKLCKS